MRQIPDKDKVAIIAEYLEGNTSYRDLGKKYNVDHNRVFRLVNHRFKRPPQMPESEPSKSVNSASTPVSEDVQSLERQLVKAKLEIKLLNAVIDIAETELKIEIRKKSGTKRS